MRYQHRIIDKLSDAYRTTPTPEYSGGDVFADEAACIADFEAELTRRFPGEWENDGQYVAISDATWNTIGWIDDIPTPLERDVRHNLRELEDARDMLEKQLSDSPDIETCIAPIKRRIAEIESQLIELHAQDDRPHSDTASEAPA